MIRSWIWIGFLAISRLAPRCQAHVEQPFDGATDLAATLGSVKMAPGFSISLYHDGALPKARSLAISKASAQGGGDLIVYVSSSDEGKVWSLVDVDGDGRADHASALLSGLDSPVGIAWHGGALYVAHWVDGTPGKDGEMQGGSPQIMRLPGVDAYAVAEQPYGGTPQVLLQDELPSDRSHAFHYLRVNPAGTHLIIPQGVPCNICVPPGGTQNGTVKSTRYASISAYNLGTGALEPIATGVRNTVGFDWHPDDSSRMYFTDNGRDQLGDDRPDCELNLLRGAPAAAEAAGSTPFYGYPFCHPVGEGSPYLRSPGKSTPLDDPDVNKNGGVIDCAAAGSHIRPVQPLGPHSAPLGMRMYKRTVSPAGENATGEPWPADYDRAAVIALHGSWNRALLNGYKVVAVSMNPDGAASKYWVLADFLQGQDTAANKALGRPVDVEQLPDGSLLVTDDGNGAVYRIAYGQAADNAAQGRRLGLRRLMGGMLTAMATGWMAF